MGTFTTVTDRLLECQDCEAVSGTYTPTSTPSPAPTWDGTGTPPSTATGTPTGVATVTVSPTPGSPQLVCESSGCIELSDLLITEHFEGEVLVSVHPENVVTMNYHRTSSVASPLYVYWRVAHAELQNTTTSNKNVGDRYKLITNITLVDKEFVASGITPGEIRDVTYDWDAVTGSTNWLGTIFTGVQLHGAIGVIYRYNLDIFVSTSPVDFVSLTPTPTPMVTATPYVDTGYCSTVIPHDEFGWDLWIPDGEANCDIGWEQFEALGYVIPAVQICLQPVLIGVVTLWGEEYEMGVYALALAAAFFWRFWSRI